MDVAQTEVLIAHGRSEDRIMVLLLGFLLVCIAALTAATVFFQFWNQFGPELGESNHDGLTKPALGKLNGPFEGVLPISAPGRAKLQRELIQAGYYHAMSVTNFLAVRNAAILSWALFVACYLSLGFGPTNVKIWLVAIGGFFVIYGLPRVMLSSKAERRASQIQNDLPDALDMMTMMMSGGITMENALQNVIGEFNGTHPDLAAELGIVARQTITGSFDQAMLSFAKRLDLPDVTTLAALMRRSNRLGGRIADALREYADSMRRIRHQKAEERGNKASVKLLLPVLFCLAPPIYILLLGPSVLQLREFVTRENQPGGILTPSVESANRLVRDDSQR